MPVESNAVNDKTATTDTVADGTKAKDAAVTPVTITLTTTVDMATPANKASTPLELRDPIFYEVVRRIPKSKLMEIEATLEKVTPVHIASLHAAMANQKCLLEETSFIHDEMFPFAALKAMRMGEISPIQLGSLMALWGDLKHTLPKSTESDAQAIPEYVPLFTADGVINQRAYLFLLPTLETPLPNLVVKTPEEILKDMYDKAIHLPHSEQGFWIVTLHSRHTPVTEQTITQRIKSIGVNFLALRNDNDEMMPNEREMIPSLGLQQVFLDVAFPNAVRMNPVIGDSTVDDIRKGSLERYRDIALPFPGHELPKVADNFPAPAVFDFMYHDRYHAIRASRITPHETELYVAIGDNLNAIQKHYHAVVQHLNKRHDAHLHVLPEFGKAIEKLPADKQRNMVNLALKKLNQEGAIIEKLKKMRKSTGQLKFRIWDMERALSGGSVDGPTATAAQELQRIIGSIEVDLHVLGDMPNTVGLSKYSGRRAAQAVLDAVKPEAANLEETQKNIRAGREASRSSFFSFLLPEDKPGQQGFDDAILESHPVSGA